MACLVLPSETARLVYGYLVKEKLDNIAFQFLENSPYLTDCYHIVKSGFQFNTKFLYKELHELIQEYSTIQNLVNKKVGLLPKSSPLYKSIRLQCENLSEIIDLILFWKYSESQNEEHVSVENKSKDLTQSNESKTDKTSELNVNEDVGVQPQDTNCNEYVSSSTMKNDNIREELETEMFEEADYGQNDKFSIDKSDSEQSDRNTNSVDKNNTSDVQSSVSDNISDKFEIENQKSNSVSDKSSSEINLPEASLGQNNDKDGTIGMSMITNEPDVVNLNEQVQIVQMEKDNEENLEKNELSNTFVQHLEGIDTSMNMENGSVLYVPPDVGNITINQDKNQIIVIPIDYYKVQASCQSDIGNGQIQAQNLNGDRVTVNNGIIFEDISVSSSAPITTAAVLPSSSSIDKKSFFDDAIITEETYLKNKSLIYELENKIKPHLFPELSPLKMTLPAPISSPAPLQTVFLPQVINQPETKNRRILPKRDTSVQNHHIVLIQPLLEKNGVVKANRSNMNSRKCTKQKKAKCSVVKDKNTKVEEKELTNSLSMPSIRTPRHDKDQNTKNESASAEKVEEVEKMNDSLHENTAISKKINEEKENLETGDKKIETPVIIIKKNSKRLSLSTPRRRSHIRALEFETPPKSGNEKKKSRTSPKVKVDEIKAKNKNVRYTLFKSPDTETAFKTPSCLKSDKRNSLNLENSVNETLCDMSVSPETSSRPIMKSENEWNNVADSNPISVNGEKKAESKKSWDADLRDFIGAGVSVSSGNVDSSDKKRTRKSKKVQKDEKNCAKNESPTLGKCKGYPVTASSSSKINLTAKRNTYSISGNDEGSPVRSLFEELDLVTPFKDPEPVRSVEETPLTKFFRENVNGLDIDLNMMNTPIFPPTPSITITPDVEDSLPLTGTYYYTPLKDTERENSEKTEVEKVDEKNHVVELENMKKRGSKETHEKVIGELVSKAKEIIGLKNTDSEESILKKPPSGKVLSMVKIQMITQCDKKLYENIPINDEPVDESKDDSTLIEKISEEAAKFDLKCELEEKRKRALRKIKSVNENLKVQPKKKGKRSPVKRKNADPGKFVKKARKGTSTDSNLSDEKDSSENNNKETEVHHSTPIEKKPLQPFGREESSEKSMLDEIREEFPPFRDSGEFSELPDKTRKKLHYIQYFLNSKEIVKFLENYDEKSSKLKLKPSHRKFFQVFYKWLKHPHAREVNSSEKTKDLLKEYRTTFEKIKTGISLKISSERSEKGEQVSAGIRNQFSDDEGEVKQSTNVRKKEDDTDDGPVSILPLKKRKAPVQPLEAKESENSDKAHSTEAPSRTQNLLQDIDVDRFLSQIHGQENR